MTWKPDMYFVDGSGAKYSQDARLRRVGWSIACLKQNAELKEAHMGQRPGKTNSAACRAHGSCRASGEHRNPRMYVIRVDAQLLQTSIGRSERAQQGANGDMCSRFFEARNSKLEKPLCSEGTGNRWHVRSGGNIFEANAAAIFAQPKCEFLSPRTPAHRKTRQQRSCELQGAATRFWPCAQKKVGNT